MTMRPRTVRRSIAVRTALTMLAALAVSAASSSHAQEGVTVPGRGAPTVRVPRAPDSVAVDAQLSEPAWATAVRLAGFSQYLPVDERPAAENTEVRLFYTSKALYVGIIATAHDPGSVRATLSKRDNIANDDRVTIYLDTFNDRRRAFFLGANALGVQVDGVRTEGAVSAGNIFGGSVDLNPDFQFETAGRRTSTGFVIEMRIPFKSLRFPTGEQRWGLQVVRDIPGRSAQDTWTDARRGSASLLAQSGELVGIEDIDRGVVTDIQPFITEAIVGSRDPVTGTFTRDNGTFDAGVNVRLGFPSFAIDATVNPDFSQVESDAGLVTVNERFTLFLPERRPFFLEGIELFATPGQLVYSRRIANPIAGGKLTGKLGRFGVAYLSALDDSPGENALFNVARFRTDYGGSSVAALTLTDRRQGNLSNTVIAADNRYVFRDMYYVETQFGQSLTSFAGTQMRSAPIWKAEADRTGRLWGFNYQLNGIGERFQSDAGFVPRTGYVSAHGFNRFAWLGKTGSAVQNITMFAGPTRLWKYGELSRAGELEGREEGTAFVTFRGGWTVNSTVRRQFFAIDPSVATGLQATTIEGELVPWAPNARLSNLWSGTVTASTQVFERFNASASLQRGAVPIFVEATEGRELRVSAALSLRPTPGTRLELTLTDSRIRRADDGSRFARVTIPRLKAELQPTRALFFRVVSQYRADRLAALRQPVSHLPLFDAAGRPVAARDLRSIRTDWLVQYEPSPGTTAFFGYGDGWNSSGSESDTTLRRRADGFFLKLAYLFRR
ncbi:MAG: DUF5916 domain-containing protein [Gemmatimonadaceae bacterium]